VLSVKKLQIMKKYIVTMILGIALLFTANRLSAQPGFDDDVDDVPVDAGISLLLTAAMSYGVTKIRLKGKEEQ
jgi:hypothetical protein